ncbi:Mor transcription activator family [Yersinia pseudotuberculosis]|nr:Mor transcription activator family [Yersinia pseudotuberculosis]CQH40619.1 Mor transcription activator family [Yersinia pseudotuberculosis]SQA49083.1 Mor transcription activator family [Yersinia pseudotuberculosis]
MMDIEQVKALLPESVQQIAELIGYPATARLLDKLGGTTFPIGKGLRALGAARATLLRETIGDENAQLLVKHFGGEVLYLPRCDRALRELRNRSFLAEFSELRALGVSSLMVMTQLCPKYGFSDRFAWGLLAERKTSNNELQSSLF